MSKYNEISFFEFQERFQIEDDCFQYLKKIRWPDGYSCPKCGHNEAYFIEKRKLFQCKNCRHQTTVTVNTIFHRTHVPLKKWFWAIFLVGTDKRGCSAKRLEKLIGVHYTTAWLMIHKIRKAMGKRDSLYKLCNFIEMDDSYFGGSAPGKRGRGAANKSKVIVAVENRGTAPGYATMEVIESMHSNHLKDFALRAIEEDQTIHTDDFPSYNVLNAVFHHLGETVKPHEAMDKLPWVHILIGNAKSFIRGTYHGVSHKHLQSYLNEFCYRFNRRFNELLITDRLLTACLNTSTITYAELTR
ncbi:MAG: IS1595 family transposase [Candidatus Latescibacter sp.]|nr:IS1595 family transposase [Candidatus Latescibacter sp.]